MLRVAHLHERFKYAKLFKDTAELQREQEGLKREKENMANTSGRNRRTGRRMGQRQGKWQRWWTT